MQINNSNTVFTSRNIAIRKADEIARRINATFPRVSSSHVFACKNIDKFGFLEFNLREKTRQLRNLKSSKFNNTSSSLQKLRAFLDPIKERKIGNCGESAQIAAISAKINGINDAQIVSLRTKGGRKLDHAALYVQNGESPYIIDPWVGSADYVPNMLTKYTSEYRNSLDIGEHLKAKDLKFSPYEDDTYSRFLKKEISEEDKKALTQLYPQLLIKQN